MVTRTARGRTGFVDWLLRSRRTGRITLVQRPNWSLTVWLVAAIVLRLTHPHGALREGIRVVGTAALAVWAADEVLRGVNPFRRGLGAVVLVGLVLSLTGLR
jgi:hypothetical protein